MVVILDRPVMLVSPVNVTPALVIVQSFVHSNTPIVSGVALVQLHSVEITRSKQTVKVIKAKKSFMVGLFTGIVFQAGVFKIGLLRSRQTGLDRCI